MTRRWGPARISWLLSLYTRLVDRPHIAALVNPRWRVLAEAVGHERFGGEAARRVASHGRQELLAAERERMQFLDGGDRRRTGNITKQGDLPEAVARPKRRAQAYPVPSPTLIRWR